MPRAFGPSSAWATSQPRPACAVSAMKPTGSVSPPGYRTMWPSNRMARFGPGEQTFWVSLASGQRGIQNRKGREANIPVHAAPGNDWKQAAAGGIHTVALRTDGTLWAWGDNWAGSLGTGSTSNSAVPVQVGSSTNWVKVWAGTLESVALQSDGSLWYWGDNPDPAFDQGVGQILVPTRISPDTNWVDVGLGVNTVFAIKSDGTLWTWGRNAHVYTESQNPALDAMPTRVGTNSDWASIPACGLGWCQGSDEEGRFTLAHGCFGFRR